MARRAALQSEISEVLRPFYCTVCEKQFQNVAQYDEHTNSYAHHHKIRFREMQTAQRAKQNTPEEQDKRKEKERKREEKELRKIAAAAGVRMAKSATSAQALAPVSTADESKPAAFKKGGWASIPSRMADSSSTETPSTRTDLAPVGSPANPSPSSSPAPDTISSDGSPAASATSQPRDLFSHDQVQDGQRPLHQPAPAFRTGGWSSIDSTTQIPPPPPPLPPRDVSASAVAEVHRLPEPQVSGPLPMPTTSSSSVLPETVPQPPPVLPSSRTAIANSESLASKPSRSKKEREAELRENARSGWQTFQKGGRRK